MVNSYIENLTNLHNYGNPECIPPDSRTILACYSVFYALCPGAWWISVPGCGQGWTAQSTEKHLSWSENWDQGRIGIRRAGMAGIAQYFKIDPVWVRLIAVLLLFEGIGFIAYLFLWIFLPEKGVKRAHHSKWIIHCTDKRIRERNKKTKKRS